MVIEYDVKYFDKTYDLPTLYMGRTIRPSLVVASLKRLPRLCAWLGRVPHHKYLIENHEK